MMPLIMIAEFKTPALSLRIQCHDIPQARTDLLSRVTALSPRNLLMSNRAATSEVTSACTLSYLRDVYIY